MSALLVTDATWNRDVLRADVPVLVEVTANWCRSGHVTRRAVDRIAGECDGHIRVLRLDLDSNPLTVRRYAINSIPTILVIERGRVTRRLLGTRNIATLREEVADYLPHGSPPTAPRDGSAREPGGSRSVGP